MAIELYYTVHQSQFKKKKKKPEQTKRQRFGKFVSFESAVDGSREVKHCSSWRDVGLMWVSPGQQMLEGRTSSVRVVCRCWSKRPLEWVIAAQLCSAHMSVWVTAAVFLSEAPQAHLHVFPLLTWCLCLGVFIGFPVGVVASRDIFPKWSHTWTTPPSPRQQFLPMFESRRGARVTIGGMKTVWLEAKRKHVCVCWWCHCQLTHWNTGSPCRRRRLLLITALLCLLSVMSPGSPLNPAPAY